MNWQDRFRIFLEQKGLSQTDVAKRMRITQGALGHWLSGRREINLSAFIKLCKAVGADPQQILFGDSQQDKHVINAIRSLLNVGNNGTNVVEKHK